MSDWIAHLSRAVLDNAKQACDPAACLLQGPQGLDNLLYSADADFSCFADLAVTSPVEYYREGQGSLLQCVLTPADSYMPLPNEAIAAKVHEQVSVTFWVFLPCISCCVAAGLSARAPALLLA